MNRRGRRLEADKFDRSLEIAARVYQAQHALKISKNKAYKEIASQLGYKTDDTVRAACRLWKAHPTKVSVAALTLEIELDANPSGAGWRARKLRGRVRAVQRNRGYKRN